MRKEGAAPRYEVLEDAVWQSNSNRAEKFKEERYNLCYQSLGQKVGMAFCVFNIGSQQVTASKPFLRLI